MQIEESEGVEQKVQIEVEEQSQSQAEAKVKAEKDAIKKITQATLEGIKKGE